MKTKWFVLSLVAIACFSLAGTGYAKHKKSSSSPSSTGDFDYYLLTLSWAPEFCATNPNGKGNAECDPNKHMGLVVPGRGPQYDNGKWPQDCASPPPVASAT